MNATLLVYGIQATLRAAQAGADLFGEHARDRKVFLPNLELPEASRRGQLILFLKDNPEINLSIEGHTDSRGSDKYNMKLSKKRAAAVMKHLTKKGGISKSRLTSQGFGETKPIDTNLTDEGRAANRRVEFVRTDVPPQN